MLKLESSVLDELERFRFLFQHEKIGVECIKDCEAIIVFGEKIGPFKKNNSYKLPFWKIEPYFRKNHFKMESKNEINSALIQQFADNEIENMSIVKLKPNLLLELKTFRDIIKSQIEHKNYPQKEIENYGNRFDILFNQRISKILQLVSANPSLEVIDRLTNVERVIYYRLQNIIKQFKEFFSD